ncbi:metalloproteinase inhibitor 1 [Bombina bombina]|uniref:metalloproteinase inhibitor 1 n=1 Tax=Bombina bombina TaxID=8345 RepID=UPI00235AA732|nr:metalloproteinase inhibitor 1 [Bombina bombina]
MFFALFLVIFACISKEAWSCRCALRHPQSAYCNSDVVIRAKFVGQTLHTTSDGTATLVKYEIKTIKIFKAPAGIQDIQFLYTPQMDSLCGYSHHSTNKSEEFAVTGFVMNDRVHINLCGFITPWASLSPYQKKGFQQLYKENCQCQIIPCYSVPCETENNKQCLWTDLVMKQILKNNEGPQSSKLLCVENNDGFCVWESMKSRLYTTVSKLSRSQ